MTELLWRRQRIGRWRAKVLLLLVTVATATSVLVAGGAQAAGPRPLFQLPFKCGEVWRLSTYVGHDDYDIDMTATTGTTANRPILASYGGTVGFAGWDSGGGWMVRLNHGSGWSTLYLHMVERPAVSTGQSVTRGQQLGRVGSTGDSSGPHLHFEQLRDGAKTESYFNGQPSGITHDTNDRTHGAVVSASALPFTPKAMATLKFNTILVTSTAGQLYRVDVQTNNTSLVFNRPVLLGGGWTHDLLTYDGSGHLYGIAGANSTLRRYTISGTKPGADDITGNTIIGTGFTLKTLATAGPDWLLGTTTVGELLSYRINGAGAVVRHELRSSTWQVFSHLVSPGAGVFYGHRTDGSLTRYLDPEPFDGNGNDVQNIGAVDSSGWSQVLLSAQPFTLW